MAQMMEDYCTQPSPGLNSISFAGSQLDSITAFAQSNQNCNNLYNQLNLCRHEAPERTDQLRDLTRALQDATTMGMMADPQHVIRLQQNVQQLQSYLFELEQKIARIRHHLMNQIETSSHLMTQTMNVLVGEQLVQWLVEQKELSCAPRAMIRKHYDKLGRLDVLFEECGRQVLLLINLLNSMLQSPNDDADYMARVHKMRSHVIEHSRQFVWQSLIVAVQPPAVLVKCRGSDSHRSTKFPCKTEIRLLGGEALGVRGQCNLIRTELITEDTARRIQSDPCATATKDTSFHLIYNEARIQQEPNTDPSKSSLNICRAQFDRIRLVESPTTTKRSNSEANGDDNRKGTRRSKVSSLRYYLAYQIELAGHHYIEVRGYKLSLPVAALVHSSLEAEASLFWNRSFAEGTGILSPVPDAVPWHKAKKALNLKFMALMQEPQDIKELNVEVEEPRSLSEANLDHLAARLHIGADGLVHKRNFFNKTVAHRENKADGKPTPCVFYDWFYKCASIVNKYMQEQWNEGLIDGFCSQSRAESSLNSISDPTMLIRFSDMVCGYLKISCKLADQRVVHYETEADKMPAGTSIADAIRSNPTFASIQYIFPNHRVARLWQDRERMDESRSEGWSSALPPGYFDTTYSLESKPVAAVHTH